MKLSKKDKSFVLLIASSLIVLWAIFSLVSNVFFSATFRVSDAGKIVANNDEQWFNSARQLKQSDFKDKILLLNFWNYSCVACTRSIADIKKLEDEFGSKLMVISIHSPKFENEKNRGAIKKSILRRDIEHVVINDSDLKISKKFNIKSWPTLVLINPHGAAVKVYDEKSGFAGLKKDIKNLVSKYKYQLNRNSLPIVLEKHDMISNVLSFPTRLEYTSDFSYKSGHNPALFISNSGKNNIIVTTLSGEIILQIGSGVDGLNGGFKDGNFETALFRNPRGLAYSSKKLYIADVGNHAIRVIDFETQQVTTLIGTGKNGSIIQDNKVHDANGVALSSPSDLEFFSLDENKKGSIAIANSGTNQILLYNLKKNTISVLAGDGLKEMRDGKYPNNSLAQTSSMSYYDHKLYFTDSGSSSLRVISKDGEVKTLIGKGLNESGHVNGDKLKALMQNPLAITVDDTGAYIVDSFNHSIRRYDFASLQIRDLIGGKASGDAVGKKTEFDEPEDIVPVLNSFYIADSNNNRIVIIDRYGYSDSEVLNVMPPLKLPKEGFLQYLPNLQKSEAIKVKSGSEISLKIDLKSGWKINELGPSFVNLLELKKKSQANLVANFDWNAIKKNQVKLPKLKSGNRYAIQGSIYYCEDKKNALCYIKSYEQEMEGDSDEDISEVVIRLGY